MKFKVIAENGVEKEFELFSGMLKKIKLFLKENQTQEDVFDIDDDTDIFYYIDYDGFVDAQTVYNEDDGMFEVANACKDDKLMEKRALNETLNRLMWRFSMQNGGRDIDWENEKHKFCVLKNNSTKGFFIGYNTFCNDLCTIYFINEETAERCIEEVIKPFLAEHPDFEPNVY